MSLKALKKALKNKNRDDFPLGAVIRWVASGRYTYAAIKSPVGWFTTSTGNPFTPQILDFDGLVEVLSRAETTDVEYATEWTPVTD